MGVASLPMYDLPEVSAALDALWAGIARHLCREGMDEAPEALVHGAPLRDLWADPELLLSQCCGFDLVKSYTRTLRPVATPRYAAPGCDGCRYSSVVIVAADSKAAGLEDLRGGVCAVNGPESHSGMNALRALIAPLSRGGRFFSEVWETGTHSDSVAMIVSGKADGAAIDCVTYALLARHRPRVVADTRILCWTEKAPGIPYVTRTGVGTQTVERLRGALFSAFDDPDLAAARDELFLAGLEVLPHDDYYELVELERRAIRQGYPKLQ